MNLEFALESPNFSTGDQRFRWWHMRPCTGYWWADIFWLLVVANLNQQILPAIFGSHIPIDILTPWLVISFIVGSPLQAFLMWFLGSMFLETTGSVPKGLYLCAYWIILSVLMLSRRTLSWKLVIPWLVTFFLSSFWISFFEMLMVSLRQDSKQLDFGYFFSEMVRIFLSCLIGMAMAQSWMVRFKGESVRGERRP